MRDRYGENGEPEAPNTARMRAYAVVACELCDDHGYRGSTVCDHIDHQAAAKRGMAMVREAMGWKP